MSAAPGRLGELLRLFGRLGFVAFGGPAAHIAMMHDEVVSRRRWLSDQDFIDMVGATSLVPGPNSTEMTMHLGHRRAGWRGVIVAGASFILPAALIVTVLAVLYVEYGTTPNGEAILYGVKPVIIAIIVQALLKLGATALKTATAALLAVGAAAAWLVGVSEILLLLIGALVMIGLGGIRRSGGVAVSGIALLALPAITLRAAASTSDLGLWRLFGVFVKVGAVLYGSGYVLLAFLRADLVERLAVLTDQQLLDAIAIGQVTPGPVFTTATFIGYVLAGLPGAVVATVGIFLPAFLFVGLLARLLPALRQRGWTADLLDGVNAVALGLMAAVLLRLGGDALVDPLTVVLAAAAGLLVWRTNLNSAWIVLGAAGIGLGAGLAGVGPP